MSRYFSPKLFAYLGQLADNNNREWFKANQDEYERHVREPALEFITDFTGPLESISSHFVADPRKVGGSLFRIHRDTRFGTDKTPYKLNTGMHFRHERAKDAHAPGFYVHLQPGECFMGVGLWRPETKVAYAIREHIAANPKEWIKATQAKRFSEVFSLAGDSLKRPPKGFEPDHPLIDDLKRKDFIATARLTQRQVTSATFMDDVADNANRAVPLMRMLCEAVGVGF